MLTVKENENADTPLEEGNIWFREQEHAAHCRKMVAGCCTLNDATSPFVSEWCRVAR